MEKNFLKLGEFVVTGQIAVTPPKLWCHTMKDSSHVGISSKLR